MRAMSARLRSKPATADAPFPHGARVAVIGAGVIGTAVAFRLTGEGYRVSLIDPRPPGTECSSGNAGHIMPYAVAPVALPGAIGRVPQWLADPLAPFTIRWSYLPQLAPWLARFLAASLPERVEAISAALAAICAEALPSMDTLLGEAGARDLLARQGLLYVFESDTAWAGAAAEIALMRRHGVRFEEIGPGALREIEPALGPTVGRALLMPDNGHLLSPAGMVARLAEAFVARGGEVVADEVHDIVLGPDGPTAIVLDGGERACDAVVLAAGARSRPLAERLGAAVPLDTERGYHVMLPRPGLELRMPFVSADGGLHATPMADGIRLAGTVELGGLEAPPNPARADRLLEVGRRLLPGLADAGATRWMGFRPSMPDSLPVIGLSPKVPRAALVFGHGHLGMTLSAVTARLVADLATGRAPSIDPAPYRPGRFA
jgi:D-amino-acid dehydrogenase